MTAQFWLWLVLSGVGGGIAGWLIRGRSTSGRELTVKREYDNRLCAVEDDARRSLERARAESEAHWRKLAIERDILYARLSEVDPRGRWRSSLASATEPSASASPTSSASETQENGASASGVAASAPSAHRAAQRPRARPGRPSPSKAISIKSTDRDDLKRIKGIGPMFERRLNEMGYTTYLDLAKWGPEDFDRLGERLGSRIRLQEWSAQATTLHHKTHNASN